MVIEYAIVPFLEWLSTSFVYWLMILGGVVAAALIGSWLVVTLRHGPVVAFRCVGRVLSDTVVDLALIAPRRVLAMAWLAVKESIRRRVVVVFAVFLVLLLFAGWFLDPASSEPARLYLSFVLTATSYLVLLLALFLSALSLPADIKNKTLHTVVTKPVRPSEIVLGRILGFTAVGTVLLGIMALMSYVFVVRGLSHTHQVADADLRAVEQIDDGEPAIRQGHSSRVHKHRHEVTVDASGGVRVELEHGHWHDVSAGQSAGETVYQFGPPRGRLVARVPVYARQLRFKDPTGEDAEEGVNVGDEWGYRSFIRGGSLAAAIWTFEDITTDRFPKSSFPDGLPLEMTLEVFRTYKGQTDDPKTIPGILGSLSVGDPKTGKPIEVRLFTAKDFATDVQYIPRQVETPDGRKLDLFKDLAPDGRLEVWIRCIQPMQYFGMARADVYFRARNAQFWVNLAKGYFGIWLQMVLVIGIGAMYSTFLSGPIALLATMGTLLGGFFSRFMGDLGAGAVMGGGPIESLYRLVTQKNLIQDLEPGLKTTVIEMIDHVLEYGLWVTSSLLPEFDRFSFSEHVAKGFDVSGNLAAQCALRSLAFLIPVFVAGYLFLKTREVAR
ncbi:MAG: hypothetical protein JXB62_03905 [Pirellulales bacterium]|nr:hypothetical protein [Pirellulales bacterium]